MGAFLDVVIAVWWLLMFGSLGVLILAGAAAILCPRE